MSSVITFLVITSLVICFVVRVGVVFTFVAVVFIVFRVIQSPIVAPSLCLRPSSHLLPTSAPVFVLSIVAFIINFIISIGSANKNANIVLWSGGAATASTRFVLPFVLRTRHLLSHRSDVLLGVGVSSVLSSSTSLSVGSRW